MPTSRYDLPLRPIRPAMEAGQIERFGFPDCLGFGFAARSPAKAVEARGKVGNSMSESESLKRAKAMAAKARRKYATFEKVPTTVGMRARDLRGRYDNSPPTSTLR